MNPPSVSVCTTIYNEGFRLSQCLRSFRVQLDEGDEIVICDAESTDGSLEIEKKYADVVVVHPREDGKPITRGRGRQIATEYASGDIIVSTDGDVIAPEGYIQRIKEYFAIHPEVSFVYGDTYDFENRVPRTAASLVARKLWQGAGCNSAFRRGVFFTTRGYQDRNWWEDTELFNEFPGEKHYIDNPVWMILDNRFIETYWLIGFILMGAGYAIWKFVSGGQKKMVKSDFLDRLSISIG